ncbi:unnamed protein product, partial [Urochloa humidicola]
RDRGHVDLRWETWGIEQFPCRSFHLAIFFYRSPTAPPALPASTSPLRRRRDRLTGAGRTSAAGSVPQPRRSGAPVAAPERAGCPSLEATPPPRQPRPKAERRRRGRAGPAPDRHEATSHIFSRRGPLRGREDDAAPGATTGALNPFPRRGLPAARLHPTSTPIRRHPNPVWAPSSSRGPLLRTVVRPCPY